MARTRPPESVALAIVYHIEGEGLRRCFELLHKILALQEEHHALPRGGKALRARADCGKRRKRARRDDVRAARPFPAMRLDPLVPPRSHSRPVSRIAARRNAAFLRFDSTSVKCRSGSALRGDRDDEPGKPGAAPKIDPVAEFRRMVEELQAVGDVPRPDVGERRRRDEIVRPLPFSEERDEALEVALAQSSVTKREAGERIRGRARVTRHCGRPVGPALDVAQKPRQRRGRDAVDAAGLAEVCRTHGGSFWRDLGGEPADRGVVEVGGSSSASSRRIASTSAC